METNNNKDLKKQLTAEMANIMLNLEKINTEKKNEIYTNLPIIVSQFTKSVEKKLDLNSNVIDSKEIIIKIQKYLDEKSDKLLQDHFHFCNVGLQKVFSSLDNQNNDEKLINNQNIILNLQETISKIEPQYQIEQLLISSLIKYTNQIEDIKENIEEFLNQIEAILKKYDILVNKKEYDELEDFFNRDNDLIYQQIKKDRREVRKMPKEYAKILEDLGINLSLIDDSTIIFNNDTISFEYNDKTYKIGMTSEYYSVIILDTNKDNKFNLIYHTKSNTSLINDYQKELEYIVSLDQKGLIKLNISDLFTKKYISGDISNLNIDDNEIQYFLSSKYNLGLNLKGNVSSVEKENLKINEVLDIIMEKYEFNYITALDTINASNTYSHLMSNGESSIFEIDAYLLVEKIINDLSQNNIPLPKVHYYMVSDIDINKEVNTSFNQTINKISEYEDCNILNAYNMYKNSDSFNILTGDRYYEIKLSNNNFFDYWLEEQKEKNNLKEKTNIKNNDIF